MLNYDSSDEHFEISNYLEDLSDEHLEISWRFIRRSSWNFLKIHQMIIFKFQTILKIHQMNILKFLEDSSDDHL